MRTHQAISRGQGHTYAKPSKMAEHLKHIRLGEDRKKSLTKNRVMLVENLLLNDNFIDHIINYNMFPMSDIEELQTERLPHKRVQRMLDLLARKSEWHYVMFVKCLRDTENSHIITILAECEQKNSGREEQDTNGRPSTDDQVDSSEARQRYDPSEVSLHALSPAKHGTIRVKVCRRSPTNNKSPSGKPYFVGSVRDNTAHRRILAFGPGISVAEQLEEGTEYTMRDFKVQKPNSEYNSDPAEIIIQSGTSITKEDEPLIGDDIHYTTIGDIPNIEKNSTVNILGKIEGFAALKSLPDRDLQLREVYVSGGGYKVKVTLYGAQALPEPEFGTVLQVLEGKTKEFPFASGDVYVNTTQSSKISLNPDLAPELLAQVEVGNSNPVAVAQQNHPISATISEMKASLEKRFLLCADIRAVSKNKAVYLGCANVDCHRKVTTVDSHINCPKCGFIFNTTVQYSVSVKLTDASDDDGIWVKLFTKHGIQLLGMHPAEFAKLIPSEQERQLDTLHNKAIRWIVLKEVGAYTNYRVLSID